LSRNCASTDSGTSSSVETSATASSGSPGVAGASRRPYAGHVLVLHEDEKAGKRGFAVDAIHLDEARLFEEHNAFHNSDAGVGFHLETDGIGVDGALLVGLRHVPAAVLGHLQDVDQVGLARSGAAEHTGQAGVAQQAGVGGGDLAEIDQPPASSGPKASRERMPWVSGVVATWSEM
jgi:hypothetical protein